MNHPLIIAMDFQDKKTADDFLRPFSGEELFLKVGMELFFREGPAVVEAWKAMGHRIFLDIKLHDIPNTVKNAARQLASLDVDLITVHASGGIKMMESAREGIEAGTKTSENNPDCVAVTQLTSTTEQVMQSELGITSSLEDTVIHYAANAKTAGLQGVVCSAMEAKAMKKTVGQDFAAVTPGIRLPDNPSDDQERIVTPAKARAMGSDGIVVGRSITAAKYPYQAYQDIQNQWRELT
ncbi:orotidine-5'-phosphate decarboxylase [Salibacterium salarium]|uniref:orotidine-5'-phosphate decarboxylase n=1 Tax=Salibacterium salarium TaxID=284579 RepID=UPI00278ADED2|nr:orotidine-5'-phosphate decarboxylase [Salibacterium salarium]MDQ0299071.1 orotidine-5'-phosphate decarboxylase [Salibacterium salarium]